MAMQEHLLLHQAQELDSYKRNFPVNVASRHLNEPIHKVLEEVAQMSKDVLSLRYKEVTNKAELDAF